MSEMVVFATRTKLGCCVGTKVSFATCHYIERYKQNRETLQRRNAWKLEGAGAAFRGM